jgi:arachidonate 5-lipoxygenase
MDLAHVTINEVLDYRESVLTSFSFANFPREIFVLPAKSIHDYNSINYMRRRTGMARRVRLFVTRMFGLPEEYAGDGERNIRAPGA